MTVYLVYSMTIIENICSTFFSVEYYFAIPVLLTNCFLLYHVYRIFLRLFMPALRSRCGHYIFALWFLSSFFLRLISAVADWMSTILPHMMWP